MLVRDGWYDSQHVREVAMMDVAPTRPADKSNLWRILARP